MRNDEVAEIHAMIFASSQHSIMQKKKLLSLNEMLNSEMSFSLKSLVWLTAIMGVYCACFAEFGLDLTLLCLFASSGLVTFASLFFGGEKYAQKEQLGWAIIFGCSAIPVVIVSIFQTLN